MESVSTAALSHLLRVRRILVSVGSLATALRDSDICVNCTPSKQHFLKREHVSPSTFIPLSELTARRNKNWILRC